MYLVPLQVIVYLRFFMRSQLKWQSSLFWEGISFVDETKRHSDGSHLFSHPRLPVPNEDVIQQESCGGPEARPSETLRDGPCCPSLLDPDLSASALRTSGVGSVFVVGGCPVHYGMMSSILSLYEVDASNI